MKTVRVALRPAVAVVITLVVGSACFEERRAEPAPPPPPAEAPPPRPVVARGDLAEDEKSTIELFRRSSPSVVFITTLARERVGYFQMQDVPAGAGSGFVWDAEGRVVTNYHVIRGARRALVTMYDRSEWEASLVGVAPDQDLAVLRIEAPADRLHPILVGTSKDLVVGQKVFAIGNPFGLDFTLTTGIVSALGRSIQALTGRRIDEVIQTDAAINPGNSGGPLLDSAGRLIGVNTQIASPSGASAGVGFAVPVDTVNRVVPQLIAHGKVVRPQLGITASDWVDRRSGTGRGVLVMSVIPGSPADEAGLEGTYRTADGTLDLGDIIQRVDDDEVKSMNDLFSVLERKQAGDVVTLTVLRGRSTVEVEVKLFVPEE